jgi:hypothetical protein
VTNGTVVDAQLLDFGDMKMGMGQALFLNGQDAPLTAGAVTKQWIQVNNRTFLIESIPYAAISSQLQQLPQASNLRRGRVSIRRTALLESKPTRASGSAKGGGRMKLAKAETSQPRLVVDYDLLSSSTNLTLQGDSTYLVTGTVNITGTTTIEGGTVVKYTNSSSAQILSTNIICLTGPYRPGVFTSMNDNSVGTTISGSTGAPTVGAAIYLDFSQLGNNSLVFRNLRFSYAYTGIMGSVNLLGYSMEVMDCQFVNCSDAMYVTADYAGGGGGGASFNVYNVLFSKCTEGVFGNDVGSAYLLITVENGTADQVGTFVGGTANNCYADNCVFTATGTTGIDTTSCSINPTNTGIYQIAGAGGYYLAAGSALRNAGTTSIAPALLADLQTLTTYPPVILTNVWFTTNYTAIP